MIFGNKLYVGNSEVARAYLGATLVFSASTSGSTSGDTSGSTSGSEVTITIAGIDPCIAIDYEGDSHCSDYDEVSYSIVQTDPYGETELSVVATVNLERTGDDPYVWSIASSTLPQGVTASIDDSDGWNLLIEGSFNTANTYAVKCVVTTPEDYVERWGYAMDGNFNNNFDLSEDISVTPDFSNELMPLRTLTIEGVPIVPDEATHIDVTDDDKFGIEITWDGSDVSTSVWTGDEGSDDARITVTYDSNNEAIIIEADWEPYDSEGNGGAGSGGYTLRMKAETDSCTVEDGDETTYSLQWLANELTKTITFTGGNPTCETYLILDISSIPNDGAVHEYKVVNSDNETITVLEIDTSDWSYTNTDDPDGYGYGYDFYTDEFDDQGDLSQGWARWKIRGRFNGEYHIEVDSTPLLTAIPDYDGSEMVVYVDVASDTMATFSCYDEWDCVQNNPTCYWDPDTRSCDCI